MQGVGCGWADWLCFPFTACLPILCVHQLLGCFSGPVSRACPPKLSSRPCFPRDAPLCVLCVW